MAFEIPDRNLLTRQYFVSTENWYSDLEEMNRTMTFNNSFFEYDDDDDVTDNATLPNDVSRYSWQHVVLSSLVVTVILLAIVVGNGLVIVAIAVDTNLKGLQNWFIASLAVSDLFVGLFVMPLSLASELMGYWAFGDVICELWLSTDVLLCTASILNLCLISLDRYWSITRAIAYIKQRTRRRAICMISTVWILSMVICLPPLVGWKRPQPTKYGHALCILSEEIGYVVYSSVGSFYLPLVVMVLVYFKIYLAARERARRCLKHTKPSLTASSENDRKSVNNTIKFSGHEVSRNKSRLIKIGTTNASHKGQLYVPSDERHLDSEVEPDVVRNLDSQLTVISDRCNEYKIKDYDEFMEQRLGLLLLDDDSQTARIASTPGMGYRHGRPDDDAIISNRSADTAGLTTPRNMNITRNMDNFITVSDVNAKTEEKCQTNVKNDTVIVNPTRLKYRFTDEVDAILECPAYDVLYSECTKHNNDDVVDIMALKDCSQSIPDRYFENVYAINTDIGLSSGHSQSRTSAECSGPTNLAHGRKDDNLHEVAPQQSIPGCGGGCDNGKEIPHDDYKLETPFHCNFEVTPERQAHRDTEQIIKKDAQIISVKHRPTELSLDLGTTKHAVPDDPGAIKRKLARSRERRATVVLGIVMASFIGCWLPFFFIYPLTQVLQLHVSEQVRVQCSTIAEKRYLLLAGTTKDYGPVSRRMLQLFLILVLT